VSLVSNISNITPTIHLKVDGTLYMGGAGLTPLVSEPVDMLGSDSCRFVYIMGAITVGAVVSTKVQQGNDPLMADAVDLAGSKSVIADDQSDLLFITEVYRPSKRYLRVVMDRTVANAFVNGLLCEMAPLQLPGAQHPSVSGLLHLYSPAEGTP
jgi:hypothetical protein